MIGSVSHSFHLSRRRDEKVNEDYSVRPGGGRKNLLPLVSEPLVRGLDRDGQGLGASPYLGGNKEIGVGAVMQARGRQREKERTAGRATNLVFEPMCLSSGCASRVEKRNGISSPSKFMLQPGGACQPLSGRGQNNSGRGYLHSNAERVVQRLGRGKRKGFHGEQDGPWQFTSLPGYRGILRLSPGIPRA